MLSKFQVSLSMALSMAHALEDNKTSELHVPQLLQKEECH